MKKSIRILSIFVLIIVLSTALTGCARAPLGKYKQVFSNMGTTYEFKLFSRVVRITHIEGTENTGETIVKEGKYQITRDKDDPEKLLITLEFDGEGSETSSFYQGEINGKKYIKIGVLDFVKE